MFLVMPACLQSNEEIQCDLLKVKMRMNRNELVDIVECVWFSLLADHYDGWDDHYCNALRIGTECRGQNQSYSPPINTIFCVDF